ncbi:MAG: endo alpha-1,4 polygalactosaminidase [Bacilli bacterium]
MKKSLMLIVIFNITLLFISGCAKKLQNEYGVFLGINDDEIKKLNDYKQVVIEPQEFSKESIDKLHNEEKKIYGYLNVGALEEYRTYFDRFKSLSLGVYEDWPDERWIDVSSKTWQDFIVNELASEYNNMGFDGLFLDNLDVYYFFETDDIFNGLCLILESLKEFDLKLIINGGDTFVSRCIEKDIALNLFDGVNQETVFTMIDFESKTYEKQLIEETTYFKKYLKSVKDYGLEVYLLEYHASNSLSKEINSYCKENGFTWYNANNLELN